MDTFNLAQACRSSSYQVKGRVERYGFGDGYSQRVVDGLNATSRTWSVVLKLLTSAEKATVEAFFKSHLGQAFIWVPPDGSGSGKWSCSEWSGVPAFVHDLTATFVEEFDIS